MHCLDQISGSAGIELLGVGDVSFGLVSKYGTYLSLW